MDFFENRVRWELERNGTRRKLPYFYFDNTSLTAMFTASSPKVRALLPHPELRLVELLPGRCLVAFTAFEYRRTDVEPYNEVSISFLVTFRRRQVPGFTVAGMMRSGVFSAYVWQLPVNTEHARAGGVDLFCYPKILADIQFEWNEDWVTCTLAEEGETILRLGGRKLAGRRRKPIHYFTYSFEDGAPLITEVLVNPLEFAETYAAGAVSLELGASHHISQKLREIDLGKRALVYQYMASTEAILFPAHNLTGGE
jgi:hypothetical protein